MRVLRLPDMHGPAPGPAVGDTAAWLVNLLDDESATPESIPPGRVVVAWSGSMGETLWAAHPRTWTPAGWARLDAAVARLGPALQAANATLALRTHARHILGDPHSAARFAQSRVAHGAPAAGGFAVLADPVGMLTPAMLAHAEEHLERIFDHLRLVDATGLLAGVVLTNLAGPAPSARGDGPDDDPPMRRAPVHRGIIDPAWLARGVRALGTHRPWFLEGDLHTEQEAWLGRAARD